jgi:cytochrome c-type biogenesis protein
MEALFTGLSHAVGGTPFLALAGAFAWGVMSVVLSPCHLSSIPLVVGYVSSGEEPRFSRSLGLSTTFAVGILATNALIGVTTAAAGRMMGDVGRPGTLLVAALLVAIGLVLMDVLALPWSAAPMLDHVRRGHRGALLLGLVFGTGLGPCTFAFMAPVLAVALRASGGAPWFGVALLAVYGLGHAVVIAMAGASLHLVQRHLASRFGRVGTVVLKRGCGVLVAVGGLYLACTAS